MQHLLSRELFPTAYPETIPNDDPLVVYFNTQLPNIDLAGHSLNIHRPTLWPLALGWEQEERELVPSMVSILTSRDIENQLYYLVSPDYRERPQIMFMRLRKNTILEDIPTIRSAFTRLNRLEAMLAVSKGNPVRIFQHTDYKHILIAGVSLDYEVLIRAALLLPAFFSFTLSEDRAALLMKWLLYAQDKMSEAQMQQHLTAYPPIVEFLATYEERVLNTMIMRQMQRAKSKLEEQIQNLTEALARYATQYADGTEQLGTIRLQYMGYIAGQSEKENALKDFIKSASKNPYVVKVIPSSDKIVVHLNVPATSIDLDLLERVKVVRYAGQPIAQRILNKLFFSGKYQLYVQCSVVLPLFGNRLMKADRYDETLGLPNFHIMTYHCFGSNEIAITKAAAEDNYMHMLAALIGSAMNINVMDSTVWNKFENAILMGGDDTYNAIKEISTGTYCTCSSFHRICKAEYQEEARQNQARTEGAVEDAPN